MMATSTYILVSLLLLSPSDSYMNQRFTTQKSQSKSCLYYDFLNKKTATGEKKEAGRLIKNIMFPGIYREYEDTKEVKKTIKIDTKANVKVKSRNGEAWFQSQEVKSGSFSATDMSTIPQYVSISNMKEAKLKPIARPAEFANVQSTSKKIGIPTTGGVSVLPGLTASSRPKKPIILYEFEASADCRRVREACSILDINVDFRPCPGATSGFSDMQSTLTLGGKRTVPFMIDNNPSMIKPQLTGATEIVNYLFETYGQGAKVPSNLKGTGFSFPGGKGAKLRSNARPDFKSIKPLTLYGYEGIGAVKAVREVLTELSVPHILINCANGSSNREKLIAKKGFFDVPFIIDPNTGVELNNSADIVRYLELTYTV